MDEQDGDTDATSTELRQGYWHYVGPSGAPWPVDAKNGDRATLGTAEYILVGGRWITYETTKP